MFVLAEKRHEHQKYLSMGKINPRFKHIRNHPPHTENAIPTQYSFKNPASVHKLHSLNQKYKSKFWKTK